MTAVENGRSPESFRETLSPERRARERLMLWLRETEGVPLKAFKEQTGFDADALPAEHLSDWQDNGFIERTPTHLRLTSAAYFISDSLFRDMV